MLSLARILVVFAIGLVLNPFVLAQEVDGSKVVARIADRTVTFAEFAASFNEAARRKFFHGKPPEAEFEQLKHDVLRRLLEPELLQREALRMGLKADPDLVGRELASYDQRYAQSERWKLERESRLPMIRAYLENKALESALEQAVRSAIKVTERDAETYFNKNSQFFVEPPREKISVILVGVPPSGGPEAWRQGMERASELLAKINRGESFASVAERYSSHASASEGGALGYLHRGMLSDDTQAKVDALKPGEMSAPFSTLEGLMIVRLEERVVPPAKTFDEVKERAIGLVSREKSDEAWLAYRNRLLSPPVVQVNQTDFPEFAGFPNKFVPQSN